MPIVVDDERRMGWSLAGFADLAAPARVAAGDAGEATGMQGSSGEML